MKNLFIIFISLFLFSNASDACSMYKITRDGKTIVGNNEDWHNPNTQMWFEPGADGEYGVMNVGFNDNFAQGGINEAGLIFDGFAMPYLEVKNTEGKTKMSLGAVMSKVMRTYAKVEDVKTFLSTIDLSGLATDMVVFVDKTGSYLIVEGDELLIGNETEHSFSNFYPSQTKPKEATNLTFYQNGLKFIKSSTPNFSVDYCSSVMKNLAQKRATQYSTIYDLDKLMIKVYHYQNFEYSIDIDLKKELKKGKHSMSIPELFPKETEGYAIFAKYNNPENPASYVQETWKKDSKGKTGEELEQFEKDFASFLNNIGYEWLQNKKDAKGAATIFKYGTELFPNDVNLYDSYGEALFTQKDYAAATKNYKKSLALNPDNSNAAKMLQDIKAAQEKANAPREKLAVNNAKIVESHSEAQHQELIIWVQKKIDIVMMENNIPALSVGIIKNRKVVLSRGFGLHHRNGKLFASENSIYQIASDTKKMTGIIAKHLAAEGKLELDEPIINYLGGSLENSAKEKLEKITLRQLLLHKSGLPYRELTQKRKDGEPMLVPYTEQDLLNDLNEVELKSEPGTEFGYSNLGYAVAGYVLQRASGKNYSTLIEKYISEAYAMPNTTNLLTDKQSKNLVTPYTKEDRNKETKAFIMGELSSAGGVYSNIDDLSKLMIQQIDAYVKYNNIRKTSSPLVLTEDLNIGEDGYGFGLGKKVFETGTQYGHGGDMDGFASGYLFSPENKSGLILLTSSGGRWLGELEKELFYKLTDRQYTTPKKSIESNKQSFVQKMEEVMATNGFDEAMTWFHANKNTPKYDFNEAALNKLGYKLLYELKKVEEAVEIFELTVGLFPESGNAYDSAAEAYLKNGDYDLSVEYYTKAANTNQKRYLYYLGFTTPKEYALTTIPDKMDDLFIAEGNWADDTAFVYLQGGPDFELHINDRDGLHLMEGEQNILKIYPYQAPMLNPNLFIVNPTLTIEQSKFENAQNAEILHQVVSFLKEKGKTVYVIGHSYGASICLEYLATKEILAEKVVLMGMDLDEDISSWNQLSTGELIRWENGVTPVVKTIFGWVPQDYPKRESFNRLADNLEMIVRVNMEKQYSTLISPAKLKKVISIYASQDEANGVKSQKEIDFLKANGAMVYEVKGDHHSMLNKEFMQKLYRHLRNGTPLQN